MQRDGERMGANSAVAAGEGAGTVIVPPGSRLDIDPHLARLPLMEHDSFQNSVFKSRFLDCSGLMNLARLLQFFLAEIAGLFGPCP